MARRMALPLVYPLNACRRWEGEEYPLLKVASLLHGLHERMRFGARLRGWRGLVDGLDAVLLRLCLPSCEHQRRVRRRPLLKMPVAALVFCLLVWVSTDLEPEPAWYEVRVELYLGRAAWRYPVTLPMYPALTLETHRQERAPCASTHAQRARLGDRARNSHAPRARSPDETRYQTETGRVTYNAHVDTQLATRIAHRATGTSC